MHYVGLTRVTNISSVHIAELNEQNISVSCAVQVEMNRLRTECQVELSIPILHNFSQSVLTIVYHNCRSLHLHIDDIRADENLTSGDVLALSETRLMHSDSDQEYNVSVFLIFRNDSEHCD